MRNTFFQFKQFRIEQANCAMKVTTEGAILGATACEGADPKRILDIGSGTGVLTLMLAQRFKDAFIDAVEVDFGAAQDAKSNFEASPWSDRIRLIRGDVKTLAIQSKYDLIVVNPPFFNNALKSDEIKKNLAVHDDSLQADDLVQVIVKYLDVHGRAVVLYPPNEARIFRELMGNSSFYLFEELNIYDNSEAKLLRIIQSFTRKNIGFKNDILHIKIKKGGEYTDQFKSLMRPFYLHL